MPQNPEPKGNHCITFQNVLDAAKRIKGIAHETPVLTSTSLNELLSPSKPNHHGQHQKLFFKVEALQRTGSFKFRGAVNATLRMMEEVHKNSSSTNKDESENENGNGNGKANGGGELHVVTHSSGNHAAALALAARVASQQLQDNPNSIISKVRATIVMPESAPIIKVNGVKGYGGKIIFVGNTNEARESMANKIVSQSQQDSDNENYTKFIHPSEDPMVIAGQGTTCLEFVQQVRNQQGFINGDLDAVIIPVGGGGLAAGNVIALRGMLGNHVKIILAEPAMMNDAKRSMDAGELLGHPPGIKLNSVADGLKTTLGPNTWPIVRDEVDEIITVSEEDILKATKLIWERLKIFIEPSAGVGVAVALGEEFGTKYKIEDGIENIGVILCGGNVDVLKIASLMEEKGL